MIRTCRHIDVEQRGDVFCVRLFQPRLDEPMIYELASELRGLVAEGGCRKLALSLGPESPECLYSVFLAKLITLQRVLREHGGELVICHAQPAVRDIFAACCVEHLFRFLPSFEDAVAYWAKGAPGGD